MRFWGQKTFCLVTGASRGIGKTIAIEFAKQVKEGSLFLLVARSAGDLQSTKEAILSSTNSAVQVATATLDLQNPKKEDYFSVVNSALSSHNAAPADFDHSLLVHNAGSLGNTQKKVVEMEDLDEIQSYLTLNISSMVLLNSQFWKIFNNPSNQQQRSIVQITSLAAIKPFKTWGYYCAGKACRDMFMKSVALESDIQVLSWAPGPVETEMYDQACSQTGDEELSKVFNDSREKGQVLSPQQTVAKLITVLGEKKYVKGEHVDYFEVD